jgi:hypothetical protein
MIAVMMTPDQAAKRSKAVAKSAAEARGACVELSLLHGGGNAHQVGFGDGVGATQCGIAGQHKSVVGSIHSNQSMQDGAIIFEIEQDGSEAKILGAKRANLNEVAAVNGRVHAGAAGLKAGRCVLTQQGEYDLCGVLRMERSRHRRRV